MSSQAQEREDAILAIALQNEEIEQQISQRKGKHKPGGAPDHDVAIDELAAQLNLLKTSIEDERLAISIAHACAADAAAISDILEMERIAFSDHRYAIGIAAGGRRSASIVSDETSAQGSTVGYDEQYRLWETGLLSPSEFGSESGEDQGYNDSPGPSIPHDKRQSKAEKSFKRVECTACNEMVKETQTVTCPCSDIYCKGCLRDLIMQSIKDETLYPPRCCKQLILRTTIEQLLSDEELQIFRDAQVEHDTVNRIYCPDTACGKFIPPITDDGGPSSTYETEFGIVHCPYCHAVACVQCKGPFHEGECTEDEGTQRVIQMAEAESWRRCPKCKTMVELVMGCNHITCKCRAEFCYCCGVKWRECNCGLWDENRLYSRAAAVVAREAEDGAPLSDAVRSAREREMRDAIERNHECTHQDGWERRGGYKGGPYPCDICGDKLPFYNFVCTICHLRACRSCSKNRV